MSIDNSLFASIRDKYTKNETDLGKFRKWKSNIDFVNTWQLQPGVYNFVVCPLDKDKNPHGFVSRMYHKIKHSLTSDPMKVVCRLCLGEDSCVVDEHLIAFFEAVNEGVTYSKATMEAMQEMISTSQIWLYVLINAKKIELNVQTNKGMQARTEYAPVVGKWIPAVLIMSGKTLVERFNSIALDEPGGEFINDNFQPPVLVLEKTSNNKYSLKITKERRPYTAEEQEEYIKKNYPKIVSMGLKSNKESIDYDNDALQNILESSFWYPEVFTPEEDESPGTFEGKTPF